MQLSRGQCVFGSGRVVLVQSLKSSRGEIRTADYHCFVQRMLDESPLDRSRTYLTRALGPVERHMNGRRSTHRR
jgi:hypothetical protein